MPQRRSLTLQPLGKAFPQFRELRRDDREAIAVRLPLAVPIALMIIFGGIPDRHLLNRRYNRFGLIGLRPFNSGARLGLLFGIFNKQGRAVLCADIIALPIELRRIMSGEMNVEDVGVADECWIISHPDRLRMASIAAAHLLVSRIDNAAADIAALNRDHPGQALKHRLNTPETAASDDAR